MIIIEVLAWKPHHVLVFGDDEGRIGTFEGVGRVQCEKTERNQEVRRYPAAEGCKRSSAQGNILLCMCGIVH